MPGTSPNSHAQSLQAVLARVRPLPVERVPFAETPRRVLAEDVRAERDDPPADLSGMDGYALRAADTAGASAAAPLRFAYEEVVGAGHAPRHALPPGGAVRIMTGAMLPAGADAVVKQEHTRAAGERAFAVVRSLQPGENVQARGSRLRAGEPVLRAGEVLRPQAHGMLAVLGRAEAAVYRRPRVGLLALGDELVPVGQPLAPGRLHVSNLYLLQALLARAGAEPVALGILGDDAAAIQSAVAAALGGDSADPDGVAAASGAA
ncbi:MAG TPA: molybdopterin molybdotransferase MoeA, partial [bacterium]